MSTNRLAELNARLAASMAKLADASNGFVRPSVHRKMLAVSAPRIATPAAREAVAKAVGTLKKKKPVWR